MNNPDIVMHNPSQPDAFGYQIAFVKVSASGEERVYSASNYVTEINVFESLFAKAMQCSVGVFDGGGLMETIALQPGDYIDLTIMKDEDSAKIIKRFVILSLGNVERTQNSQGKTYRITGITLPAFLNKRNTVYRGFRGRYSDMVATLCQDYLSIEQPEIEPTVGDVSLVSPGKAPFKLISQIMQHAISEEGGPEASLYFFYEDRDGHRFKTLDKVVTDAKVHDYMLSVDKNVDGETDLRKIQHFTQLKAGSQAERMAAGMYENEVLEFDHVTRSVKSTLWNFAAQGRTLLGNAPVFDKANNLAEWIQQGETKIRGLSNAVKVRSAESNDQLSRKFGFAQAQKAAFNQIIYAVQIFGTPEIKAGDVLNITAPAMSMQGDAPELDFALQGKFLVGDVRHRIVGGEQYATILNLFKDGLETEYTQASDK